MERIPRQRDYPGSIVSRCCQILALIIAVAAGLRFAAAESGAKKIYVANFARDSLSIFPLGSKGNVASLFSQTHLDNPQGVAAHDGGLYVASRASDTITAYPVDATGRPNPTVTIRGSKTQLNDPGPLAVDAAGTIYVANQAFSFKPPSITIYPAGSSGNIAPKAVIKGSKTGLDLPNAIAADVHGNIYVMNADSKTGFADHILVFTSGSNGNVAPARIIAGPATRLRRMGGIAIDSKGRLFATVVESNANRQDRISILIFPPDATGNVAPVGAIDGDCANLGGAGPLALDPNGNLYVLGANVEVYSRSTVDRSTLDSKVNSSFCATPDSEIAGDKTGLDLTAAIAADAQGNIYVSQSEADRVSIFRAGTTGNVAPSMTFGGATGILHPTAVALDASGQIYVANDGTAARAGEDSVTIYPAGTNANVSPITTTTTNIADPQAIAVGRDGSIYIANPGGGSDYGSITVFAAAGLPRLIRGAIPDLTGLDEPVGLALDAAGNLYVLNSGLNKGRASIAVFAPTADGNVAPSRTITDAPGSKKTQLESPAGIALDASGKIYVTNDSSIGGAADSITIYPANSRGSVAPIATIGGPKTQLHLPSGVAVDADGKIYVANDGNGQEDNPPADPADSITVYAPGSNGNVAPIARINGPLTGLGHPMGIAVGP